MTNFMRRLLMVSSLVATAVYLVYRGAFTLNLEGPWATAFSIALYGAELYGAFLLFLYFFQIWDVSEPEHRTPMPGRTVDVFIPTYNEDPDLLRGTIAAALAIEYPHRTYVLDDGRRSEVAALAKEMGCEYITRADNLYAKAGNLNHALEQTDGEFVIIFDADHIASPTFIDRLIGHFRDEQMAYVQTPHEFYNFDSFQATLDYKRGTYWEEGQLFYNLIQPGMNRWNAVVFCGSAAMFRRSALEDVGLIATETITEDMHTGLRLHSRGWKSLFVNERLMSGQAAPDVTSFNSQRLRWGEGNLAALAYDNPLTMKGLTIAQRLCYLGTILSWTTGVLKLVLYATPILMLLTGVAPVNELSWTLGTITAVYLFSIWSTVKATSFGHARLIDGELNHVLTMWTKCRSVWRAITRWNRGRFIVTSKRGRQSNAILGQLMPFLLLIVVGLGSVAWAASKYFLGMTPDPFAPAIGGTIVVLQALFAFAAIRRILRPRDRRYSWRHHCPAHVTYRVQTAEGPVTKHGMTVDLNERGAALVTFEELPRQDAIDLEISAGNRMVEVRGTVRHERRLGTAATGGFRYGIEFEPPNGEQVDALWGITTEYAVGRQYDVFEKTPIVPENCLLTERWRRDLRVPVTVNLTASSDAEGEPRALQGITESVGRATFVTLLGESLAENEKAGIRLTTPSGFVDGEAVVEAVESVEVGGREMFCHRFHIDRFPGQSRSRLQTFLGVATNRSIRELTSPTPRALTRPLVSPIMVGLVPSAMAAGLAFLLANYTFSDFVQLNRVASGRSTDTDDLKVVDTYVDRALAGQVLDGTLLNRLHEAVQEVEHEDAEKISMLFVTDELATPEMRLGRAHDLANAERYEEAELEFLSLLEIVEEFESDERRGELYLAAARNALHSGDTDLAIDRFASGLTFGETTPELAAEYAGLLLTAKRPDEAVAVLDRIDLGDTGLRLRAAALTTVEDFEQARPILADLHARNPEDVAIARDLANVSAWSKRYPEAIKLYAELLEKSPNDPELRLALGNVLLWSEQFETAAEPLGQALAASPENVELQQAFLDAVGGSRTRPDWQRPLVETIVQDRLKRGEGSLVFDQRLSDVMLSFDMSEQAIPILERLLKENPRDNTLRLHLADAYQSAGQFAQAEVEYEQLLARRTSPAVPVPETVPEVAPPKSVPEIPTPLLDQLRNGSGEAISFEREESTDELR